MDKTEALTILLASAVCSCEQLTCEDCPLYEEEDVLRLCDKLDQEELYKAIETMR